MNKHNVQHLEALPVIRQGPAGRDPDVYLLSGPLLWKRFATISITSIALEALPVIQDLCNKL